ncbi:MAG: hypothetical protein NC182_01725 [Prevotella sp.]|nr:hypothetical protein [Staphylococcus sp.]MCM1349902.1 hypothetical protein [Prevotella sp.]
MTYNEKRFLEKFDNGEEFTEEELSDLTWQFAEEETIYGENGSWTREATTIFKIDDRYFALEWEEGLTECQENEFYDQPYEVVLELKTEVITKKIWNKKEA